MHLISVLIIVEIYACHFTVPATHQQRNIQKRRFFFLGYSDGGIEIGIKVRWYLSIQSKCRL